MKHRLSLVGRYTFLSLALIIGSVAILSAVFTTVADSVTERLAGERLNAQVAGTANRIHAFIENRIYQLETLSNHPSMPLFLLYSDGVPPGVEELLRVEADTPDLYGILFFNDSDRLIQIIAGQAASGAPYWNRPDWSIHDLPRVWLDNTEIIGPMLPREGEPGSLLIRQPLRRSLENGTTGSIALHVRLASLTEQLRTENLAGVIRPFLRTPAGSLIEPTGSPVSTLPANLIEGPELLPGWRIDYVVAAADILRPLRNAQLGLYSLALFMSVGTVLLFWALARSLRRRVIRLVDGAEALASGDLHFRLREPRLPQDEIDQVGHAFNAMADRLQGLIQRTVQVEKMAVLGEFATGVAHEVRNPLATIKLTVQALEKGEPEPRRQSLLQDVEEEIDRLNRVVGDLLDYGRPVVADPQPVEIRKVFRHATILTASFAETQSVVVSASGDSRLNLYASPDQVIQCLVNLLSNAIEACQPGGNVRLRAHRDGAYIRIEVTDDGLGMSRDTLGRVTEPFFTTRAKGTGLGLSITSQLIHLNQGDMHVASELGEGTTVTVLLPAYDPDIHTQEQTHALTNPDR